MDRIEKFYLGVATPVLILTNCFSHKVSLCAMSGTLPRYIRYLHAYQTDSGCTVKHTTQTGDISLRGILATGL
jgi:hypothetical protein